MEKICLNLSYSNLVSSDSLEMHVQNYYSLKSSTNMDLMRIIMASRDYVECLQ